MNLPIFLFHLNPSKNILYFWTAHTKPCFKLAQGFSLRNGRSEGLPPSPPPHPKEPPSPLPPPKTRFKMRVKLQSATKWVETLRPKRDFWRFPDFKIGKCSFFSPNPSMQCWAAVRATFRKQQTPQLWMEGTGEGCGVLCSLKLPYLTTMSQQFRRRL